jgi:hypothetical protein
VRCRLGFIARYVVGGALLGCIVGVRLRACCLPSLVGRGRLKDHARLSLVPLFAVAVRHFDRGPLSPPAVPDV